jgi:hypothetical protein
MPVEVKQVEGVETPWGGDMFLAWFVLMAPIWIVLDL